MSRLKPKPIYFVLLAIILATFTGCGDSGSGLVNNDASTNTSDASTIPDGGADLDADNDGFPASEDCDDNDDTIFPGTHRDCQSDCDSGIQICLADGTWLDCTARTDCECTTPGETRIVDCGNCGEATQECGLDLIWGYPTGCLNEGECTAGTTENGPCEFCGTRTRMCGSECSWGPWDEGSCTGVCLAGAQDVDTNSCPDAWDRQLLICNASCEWENDGACSGACLDTPRTGTPDYKDEVCISGGLAFMGADAGEGGSNERPEHIVALSPFFIDVYEVTVARYRECVQAGACTVPDTFDYSTYYEPNHDDYPVNDITWVQASAFCAWDGGRALPTEAQWEKAARGPHPTDVRSPWGNTELFHLMWVDSGDPIPSSAQKQWNCFRRGCGNCGQPFRAAVQGEVGKSVWRWSGDLHWT